MMKKMDPVISIMVLEGKKLKTDTVAKYCEKIGIHVVDDFPYYAYDKKDIITLPHRGEVLIIRDNREVIKKRFPTI
ncbi:MAG: hypothetical protein ABIA21_00820 [Candidatus Aenigmatarchaeota archaeon]